MTVKTAEERVADTADLLQSLHASVQRVRQDAERMCEELRATEHPDVNPASKQLSSVEGLIRTCQKVESCLVEQLARQAGVAQGGHALDLDGARKEIGCRLARLRACCNEDGVS